MAMKETNIFKVLADSQRRDILIMLRNGRLNAGEIAEKLQITPAALSYHLKLLKGADLIAEYKEKNFIYYPGIDFAVIIRNRKQTHYEKVPLYRRDGKSSFRLFQSPHRPLFQRGQNQWFDRTRFSPIDCRHRHIDRPRQAS